MDSQHTLLAFFSFMFKFKTASITYYYYLSLGSILGSFPLRLSYTAHYCLSSFISKLAFLAIKLLRALPLKWHAYLVRIIFLSLQFALHSLLPHLLGYSEAFLQSDCAHISSTLVAIKLLALLDF